MFYYKHLLSLKINSFSKMPASTKTSTIKSVLQELMARHGLNTVQLSEYIDLPQATLRYILQGHTDNPRIETVVKLADYFEVPVDYLIGRSESVFSEKTDSENTISSVTDEGIRRMPVLKWKSARYWVHTPKRYCAKLSCRLVIQ